MADTGNRRNHPSQRWGGRGSDVRTPGDYGTPEYYANQDKRSKEVRSLRERVRVLGLPAVGVPHA